MSGLRRALGLASDRWERLDARSVWSATAIVIVAWALMALTRFGGLSFEAPRAFTRLALVGVWGWLGLAALVWLAASLVSRGGAGAAAAAWRPSSLRLTLGMVGWAHTPIQVLAVVILIAAGAMQLFGPGLVVAVAVFGVLVPAGLVTGTGHVFALTHARSAAAIAVPYAAWLLVVVRHVVGQVQHLL